jgi:transcriptional regulator with XRE-family HTH domain
MKARFKEFGSMLKKLRLAKGLGVRELAREAGVSHTLLSRVERGECPPPGEKKIRALAKALETDEQALLALSGHVPEQLARSVQKHPEGYAGLLRLLAEMTDKELEGVRIAATSIKYHVALPQLEALKKKYYEEAAGNPDIQNLVRLIEDISTKTKEPK